MELLMPGLGLVFWMTIAFGFVLLILKKYAWTPILNVLQERENKLAQSFSDAKRIEQEMSELATLKTEKIAEAEKVFNEITAKAQTEAERIIDDAKEKAREEARMIKEKADELVESYKQEAMREVKNQLSALSLDIAEKVLLEEFSDKKRNARYVNKLLDEVVMN
jgi:F-type H+-transporting ATPase subunit b